jgi:hypothetical protein
MRPVGHFSDLFFFFSYLSLFPLFLFYFILLLLSFLAFFNLFALRMRAWLLWANNSNGFTPTACGTVPPHIELGFAGHRQAFSTDYIVYPVSSHQLVRGGKVGRGLVMLLKIVSNLDFWIMYLNELNLVGKHDTYSARRITYSVQSFADLVIDLFQSSSLKVSAVPRRQSARWPIDSVDDRADKC